MHVVVIGAGVVGATTAHSLVDDGHEVTVIEAREAAGCETSFANGGQISPSESVPWAGPGVGRLFLRGLFQEYGPVRWRPRAEWDQWRWLVSFLARCNERDQRRGLIRNLALTTYSLKALRNLRDKIAGMEGGVALEYDAVTKGILRLFRDGPSLARASTQLAHLNDAGIPARIVGPEEIIAIEPALRTSTERRIVQGAIYSSTDESGDAQLFTRALAQIAEARGARFRYGTRAQSFAVEDGHVSSVKTDLGPIAADAVVLAAGVGTVGLAHTLGLRLPIYPLRGYSVTIALEAPERAPTVSLSDEGRKIVMSRLGGRLRAAGMADLVGYDARLDPRRARAIGLSVLELFPDCGHLDSGTFWAGLRPMTPDGSPILGPLDSVHNVYVNSGHGSLGWTMACGSARILADLIAGRQPAIPPHEFALTRF